jgi:predicted permease
VIGVLPKDHRSLRGFGFTPDVYMPVTDRKSVVALYARQPAGMTRHALLARLLSVCEQLDRVYPDGEHKWVANTKINAVSGIERLTNQSMLMPVAAFFAMLMTVVGLVLLIACANVASLLLARASSRAHELAIRLAIGASRGRVIRQLLAESLLLAFCGTCAGLILNIWLTALLSRIELPLPIPVHFQIEPDWRLLTYSAGIAIATSLLAGLMPALKGTRAGLNNALKQDEHQVGRSRLTLRVALVAGQLAVSVVLLSAAVLFMRNLMQASSMYPGFDVDHTAWAYMRLVPESYTEAEKTQGIVNAALLRLRGLPGVESATIARMVPMNDNNTMGGDFRIDGGESPMRLSFYSNRVGPDYFKTMGIQLLRGREFFEADRKSSPEVAILNEVLARRMFGNENPVGHTFRQGGGKPVTVVGVVKVSKYFTLGEEPRPAMFTAYAQMSSPEVNLHFLVRSQFPETLVKSIDSELLGIDSTAAMETKPMRNALGLAMLPSRVGAVILGSTGLLGLALAAIGLYGVLLYTVGRRTREIGLRMALGATPGGILRMVVGESLVLVAVGVGAGIALAFLAVRPLAMFLIPEVRPSDPSTFGIVAVVLVLVALVATMAPATRALRVDPVTALRHD